MTLSKKSLLFAYPEMMVGGSTTSLISLLNALDYSQYEVDLILYRKQGELLGEVPQAVNILPQADKYADDRIGARLKKIIISVLNGTLLKAIYYEIRYNRRLGLNEQAVAFVKAGTSRKLDKQYDVAIGYLELWPNAYVLQRVKAGQKIAWIHPDIKDSPYFPAIDSKQLSKADKIVTVSEKCLHNFKEAYKDLAEKGVVVENILSAQFVRNRAAQEIPDFAAGYNGLKIITVCRLSVYTKGLDRAVGAMKRLIEEGYRFKWFVVGEGSDRHQLEKIIAAADLQEDFILLGKKTNPYPYYKNCDVYVMPSRYEGKPMSVTEAQILGLPIIVTNYASAVEQVRHNVDGIIVDNNDTDIYFGIKRILDEPWLLQEFRNNLTDRQLSNESDIYQFYDLIN